MRARKQFPVNFRSFVTLFQVLSNISVRAIEIIRKHNYEIEEKKSRCVRKEFRIYIGDPASRRST